MEGKKGKGNIERKEKKGKGNIERKEKKGKEKRRGVQFLLVFQHSNKESPCPEGAGLNSKVGSSYYDYSSLRAIQNPICMLISWFE